MWLFFGTGKFIGSDDRLNVDQQSFYGVKVAFGETWKTPSEANLLDVSEAVVGTDGTVANVPNVSTWNELLSAIEGKDGWVINFPRTGERSFTKPLVVGGLVMFTTYVPNRELCGDNLGSAYLWAVYYETGTAYKEYVFEEDILNQPSTVTRQIGVEQVPPPTPSATTTEEGKVVTFAGPIRVAPIEAPLILPSGISGWNPNCPE